MIRTPRKQTLETLHRIEDLVFQGQSEQALSLINTLYGQNLPGTDRGRALAFEVIALESLDRQQEAHNLIGDIMKEEGDDYAFVLAAGIQFADLEAYPHAELFLKNLCELQSDDPMPWFNLAIVFGRENRYSESIDAYEKTLEIEPTFSDAYFQKSICHQLMGDLESAADTYTTYLAQEPEDGEAWVSLGVLQSDMGDYESAYETFEKASKTSHDPEDLYYNWAISAVRNQDDVQIEHCILQLQDLNPAGWRTLITRADYEESQEHIWPAWEILREAFEEVLEDEELDLESRDYVVATLLRFANRNKMHEHTEEVVTRVFDEALFGEEILGALQVLEGRASNRASSHQVVLKTSVQDSDNVFFENNDRFIVYGVSAENGDQALELARAFESECSTYNWDTYSIHQLSDADEALLGIYWRSDLMDTAPGAIS
ncbi:MAG: tetratricopeptide repeat protein [Candidatus Hydrogenedentota bacterium]